MNAHGCCLSRGKIFSPMLHLYSVCDAIMQLDSPLITFPLSSDLKAMCLLHDLKAVRLLDILASWGMS